jgi:Fic family protein
MKNYNKDKPYNSLPDLPQKTDLETVELLKLVNNSNKLLAELKGYCQTLPNPNLLLNTIVLQESKESSAIENIVTTQDELYKATLDLGNSIKNAAAKEVIQYRQATYWGLEEMQKKGVITTNLLVGIMQRLRGTDENIRKNSGTKLANPVTNNIVYTPPEGEQVIRQKLAALEQFINNDEYSDLDYLIKMALIHYQFEAIHPFTDGNGRTGRILNVLYLINKNLIGLPVLYLSYYIIQNKPDYYRLLKEVTETSNWTNWVTFIVKGVGDTAALTLQKINAILKLKADSEDLIRQSLKASYSRELSDLLFSYPYIKIRILEENNIAKRQTASEYLKKLETAGLLRSIKVGTEIYYVNHQLMNILSQ